VAGQGLYRLDESGVIGVEFDALRERFNQNDGGGGTLRTKKYPTKPRMVKKLADSLTANGSDSLTETLKPVSMGSHFVGCMEDVAGELTLYFNQTASVVFW